MELTEAMELQGTEAKEEESLQKRPELQEEEREQEREQEEGLGVSRSWGGGQEGRRRRYQATFAPPFFRRKCVID